MKLGQLIDMIREVTEAELRVESCKLSLEHGGNEETMRRKQESLERAEWMLADLRDQEIDLGALVAPVKTGPAL